MNKKWYQTNFESSSKLIGSSNDETNFPHKLLLSNTQVPRTHKAFANGSWVNIRLSETRLPKMNSGGFLDVSFEANLSSMIEVGKTVVK